MFNVRDWNHCHDTVRAENLQVGDRFVFNKTAVEVATVLPWESKTVIIMKTIHLGWIRAHKSATLPNEMFITIKRR